MRRIQFSMLSVLLATTFIVLQYRLWFEDDGLRDMLSLKKSLATQTLENEKLKKRNEELAFQVMRMQKSKDAAESRARNELGMIKQGETFYQFVK